MKYLIGNWKMNGLRSDIGFCHDILANLPDKNLFTFGFAPPITLLSDFTKAFEGSGILVGAQNCHYADGGAHTGEISSRMIRDINADFVLIGHSERRRDNHETSSQIARKARAVCEAGLMPIICVGEFLEKRTTGGAIEFVINQLSRSLPATDMHDIPFMVAYEPIWAIGTGQTAEKHDIEEMHAAIRLFLQNRLGNVGRNIPLLYGGSLTEKSASILSLTNVDGGLVGGASLKAKTFLSITKAFEKNS